MVTTPRERQTRTVGDTVPARERVVAGVKDVTTAAGSPPVTTLLDGPLTTDTRQRTTRLSAPTPRVRAVRIVLRGLCRLLFRVRVEGLEHLPRRQMIVCANHMSWIDAFLVLLFLPAEPRLFVLGRRTAVMTTAWRTRVVNWLGIMIPLDLDQPEVAMRQMGHVLEQGGSLVIFPEGGWGYVESALKPLRTGAARLSLWSGLPIVPVGITGASRLRLRGRLTLRIGAPINPWPSPHDDQPGPADDDSAARGDGSTVATRNASTVDDQGDQDDLRDRGHALTDTLRQALLALLSGDTV